jgi:hypothetical protein
MGALPTSNMQMTHCFSLALQQINCNYDGSRLLQQSYVTPQDDELKRE